MWSKSLKPYKEEELWKRPTYNNAKERVIKTLNGFQAFLQFHPGVGSIVRYKHHMNWQLEIQNCSLVVRVDENFDKVPWSWHTGFPETHFIISLSNAIYNSKHFYERRVDITEYVEVPTTDLEGILNANVQDYIARALAHFKQTATPGT